MRIKTRSGRPVKIDASEIIEMVRPILGFLEERHYAILAAPEAPPFHWLQSIESPGLSFPIVRDVEFGLIYPDADWDTLKALQAETPNELAHWVIVALPRDGRAATINLRAPVIVNPARQLGAQVILREEYPITCGLNACPTELSLAAH